MKRIFLFSCFLYISFFCYAQQNLPAKIIGGIPPATSARKYQIQVGAFRLDKNAQDAISRLKKVNLRPDTEIFRNLTRVLVRDVSASQVRSILATIAGAGFREVIIREDTPSNARQESSYNPSNQESYYVPSTQAGGSGKSDKICKTWKIESCPNQELNNSKFFILDDGTYYVTNTNGESSSLSEWRRGGGNEFEYSHNGWEYYGRAEIIKLTDDALEFIDSGYSYDTPGNTSAGYTNLWIFSKAPDEPAAEE